MSTDTYYTVETPHGYIHCHYDRALGHEVCRAVTDDGTHVGTYRTVSTAKKHLKSRAEFTRLWTEKPKRGRGTPYRVKSYQGGEIYESGLPHEQRLVRAIFNRQVKGYKEQFGVGPDRDVSSIFLRRAKADALETLLQHEKVMAPARRRMASKVRRSR